jgi:hypothetical protein
VTHPLDEPGNAERKISGYRARSRRFAALGLTTQTAATRYGGPSSIVAARSDAPAIFRFVLRIAAPRSPKEFQASCTISVR